MCVQRVSAELASETEESSTTWEPEWELEDNSSGYAEQNDPERNAGIDGEFVGKL